MENESLIIAIEGMDGVGKTTIAKRVAEDYNFKYIEKPLAYILDTKTLSGKKNLDEISKNIYNFDDEILKAWFFGLGNLYTILKYKDENLIIDRHFISNYFWNGTEKSNKIFQTMIDLIGKPDLSIILYASPKTRLKRIYARNKDDYDLSDKEKHIEGYDKMLTFVNDFQIPYVIINTENKDINEVYQEVADIIKDMKKRKQNKILEKK